MRFARKRGLIFSSRVLGQSAAKVGSLRGLTQPKSLKGIRCSASVPDVELIYVVTSRRRTPPPCRRGSRRAGERLRCRAVLHWPEVLSKGDLILNDTTTSSTRLPSAAHQHASPEDAGLRSTVWARCTMSTTPRTPESVFESLREARTARLLRNDLNIADYAQQRGLWRRRFRSFGTTRVKESRWGYVAGATGAHTV